LDFSAPFLPSLEGTLFSPARGLFIYFPLTIFAIIGLAKALCQLITHRAIYLVFVVFIGVGIASVAKWLMWWGGLSYGPRLLAEVQPFLLLSSVPVCKSIFEEHKPKFGVFAFFLLFAWSSATQVLGAYALSDWNWSPKSGVTIR
jgi:hypothetical protein